MKNQNILIAALFLLAAVFSQRVDAQVSGNTADVPRIMSYQGQITTTDGIAMNGRHNITATLYSDPHGMHSVWKGGYYPEIINGIFSLELGAGIYPLPDLQVMNQELWVGISIDEGAEMKPLTRLASSPYALNVPDGSITLAKLAPEVVFGMRAGHTPRTQNVLSDPCSNNSDGTHVKNVVAGGCHNIANPAAGYAGILGGSDNSASNTYSTIGGGYSNTTSGDYSGIVGGYGNSTAGYSSVLGGGYTNTITSNGLYSVLAGGVSNNIDASHIFIGAGHDNASDGQVSAIAGGHHNTVHSSDAFIGAGQHNAIDASSGESVITGGTTNAINTSYYSFIGGGNTNTVNGPSSSIVGGASNVQDGQLSFIGGGGSNSISALYYETLSGGYSNSITGTYGYSSIGGGKSNTINDDYSAIPGGQNLTLGANSFGFHAGTTSANVSASSNIAYFGNVDLWLANDDNTARKFKLFEPSTSGSTFTSFRAGVQSANVEYILPLAIGSTNDALTLTNAGTGQLGWGPGANSGWKITGNTGTTSIGDFGTNYLGTTDPSSFEIRINQSDATSFQGDKRVMRYEYKTGTNSSPNITGGYQENSILGGFGNVICGGGAHLNGANSDINEISANGTRVNIFGFIGGGDRNTILEDQETDPDILQQFGNVIVGGRHNTVTDLATFIGGGQDNEVHEAFGVIAGGASNKIFGDNSSIVGGQSNAIGTGTWIETTTGSSNSFIGGGNLNLIGKTSGPTNAVVVGGGNNDAEGNFSFIGGGGGIVTTDGNKTSGVLSCIVGGTANQANSDKSFVGGGLGNISETGDFATIVGGQNNHATGKESFIGAGDAQIAAGLKSAIPGGEGLTANGEDQALVGRFNIAKPIAGPITTHTSFTDDPVFIVGGGANDGGRFNAFEVTPSGHSIVYGMNGTGSVTSALRGGTYNDNTILAWADADGGGGVNGTNDLTTVTDFGITKIHKQAAGVYVVTVNLFDPSTNAAYTPAHISVQVSIVDNTITDATTSCGYANVSQINPGGIGANKFIIRTYDHSSSGCTTTDKKFMFTVTGR